MSAWDWSDPINCVTRIPIHNFPPVFCFRLPDGFTQLRTLAHLALNDVSLQTLPNDIGKYVCIKTAADIISFDSSSEHFQKLLNKHHPLLNEGYLYSGFQRIVVVVYNRNSAQWAERGLWALGHCSAQTDGRDPSPCQGLQMNRLAIWQNNLCLPPPPTPTLALKSANSDPPLSTPTPPFAV